MPAPRPDARWVARSALLLWPLVVGAWFARLYLLMPGDAVPANHEARNYVYRLVEFRDLLAAGCWSLQWAAHFRSGLGSPYFGYYQPGFFYLASLVPWSVEPTHAIGDDAHAPRGLGVTALAATAGLGVLALLGRRRGEDAA